jgi:hypothetical protein
MANLGTLTLDLVAKIGGFTSGLDAAERESKKSADEIKKNIESIGVAGYAAGNALGAYLKQGIDLAINAFPELIEQAAKFQDIADKTGGSAEGFANFAVSAKVAGVSIDAIADASTKLSKNLIGVDDESKAAGAALKALNIPIADFKKLSPDEQIKSLATAFGGFADGAGKAAVAQQLLGKSGAELLKFFKDYTDNGGDVTILTAQMIQQADDFADAQARSKAQLGLYASAIATSAIPPIVALTSVIKDAIVEVYNLDKAASDAGRSNPFATLAENIGRELAKVIDYFATTKKEASVLFDFLSTGFDAAAARLSGDGAAADAMGEAFRKRYNLNGFGMKNAAVAGQAEARTYAQAFDDQLASMKRTSFAATDPRRVDLGKNGRPVDARATLTATPVTHAGAKGAADDPTKKLLDNDLAAFKAQAERAKELLTERNKVLELYNSQGLLSVKDYYTAQQANLDDATKAQAKSLDDQIEALKKFQDAAAKQTDIADAQGKINKLEEEKSKLYRASGTAALESGIKQVQAQKAVQDAFDEVNAKVLEFQGNLRAAAAIRFDASSEKLIKQAIAEGNEETVKRISLLKQYTLAQADISKAQEAFALAQGDLSIAEDRITIAQQRGTMGEIEGLNASAKARREAIIPMQAQLDTLLALDDAARSPQQIQQIERLKVQLEQLKATADPLGDRFQQIFSDAAGGAFADFITGTKTAKEAFKDFSTSVIKGVADLISKDLSKKLFSSIFGGGSDSSGGIGGIFSKLLGLGGASIGTPALAGANAVTAAGGDGLGAFISLNKFSTGGYTGSGDPNDPAGIVHKGEYVLNAKETAAIGVANLQAGKFGGGAGGGTVINNFTVGDVASKQMVIEAIQNSQRQTAGRIARSQRYAGSLS